jgi:hypothetical protein
MNPVDRERSAKHPAKVLTLTVDAVPDHSGLAFLHSAPGPPAAGGSNASFADAEPAGALVDPSR